ncbi:hypothetical protein MD484_g4732, partial [Candolleomyces efflorescens]
MALSSEELNNANEQPQAQAAPLNRVNENRYENGAVHEEPITYGGGIIRYGSATKVPVPEPTASAEGGYAAAPGNLQASWTAFMRGLETYEEADSYLTEMEKRMKKKFPTTMPGEGQTLYVTCASGQSQRPIRA